MIDVKLSAPRILYSGESYNLDVSLENKSDISAKSVKFLVARERGEQFPAHIMGWERLDKGNNQEADYWNYEYPIGDLEPHKSSKISIPFDISPKINTRYTRLHFLIESTVDNKQVTLRKKSRLFLLVPRDIPFEEDEPPNIRRNDPLKIIVGIEKNDWKVLQIYPEQREDKGFEKGAHVVYTDGEKSIAIFLWLFKKRNFTENFYQKKIKEWIQFCQKIGECDEIILRKKKVMRWILPKRGIIYGCTLGSWAISIYGPTTDDQDARIFFEAVFNSLVQ